MQKTLPLGMSMYQTYNLDGSLASVTDYNGNTVAMGYDSAGRLTGKYQGSLTGPQLASLTYNTDGSLHSKTKGSVTTTYAYDALGRTTSVTNANTGTSGLTTSVGYTFDSASNKLTQTSTYGSTNTTVTYAYDADERLDKVTAPDATVTNYAFDNAGNRASVVRPNGITTLYKYDALNRLTDVVNQKTATGAIVSSYHYTLGPSGKRLDVTDQNGNVTAYTYDNDGRLVGESSAAAGNVIYGYDNVGNRLTKSVNGTTTQTFTFDANDRLTNSGYSYDNDGNVLNDPTNTYTWDWENKLIGTNAGRSNAATYVSDYDGIRVQQTTSAGTTNYTVDPESGYGNVIEERGATGTLNARYDYGDDLVRMDRGSGVYYYIFDGLGSTRQLTDASGNVDNTDSYDAFGNIVSSTGSVVNPYLFDGQEQDGTGLYYLRARYMDPERGEFLGQDPYAGDDEDPISLHRYLYASDDGVDLDDPGGEDDDSFDVGGDIDAASVQVMAANAGGLIGTTLGALHSATGAPSLLYVPLVPQVPSSLTDPDLETMSQSITIKTSRPASSFFHALTLFPDCQNPTPDKDPTGVGQRINWTFNSLIGILQRPFSVQTTAYDPTNSYFCVETLSNHPLEGYRYWRVEQVAPGLVRFVTVAVDKPVNILSQFAFSHGTADSQAALWVKLLTHVAPGVPVVSDKTHARREYEPDPVAADIIRDGAKSDAPPVDPWGSGLDF